MIYTSGTTGKPKGAVRKFPKEAMHAAMQFVAETPMRVDDIHLVTCPLYHSTAFGFLAMNGILGGTCVLIDEFKPEAFLQHVERYGVTSPRSCRPCSTACWRSDARSSTGTTRAPCARSSRAALRCPARWPST